MGTTGVIGLAVPRLTSVAKPPPFIDFSQDTMFPLCPDIEMLVIEAPSQIVWVAGVIVPALLTPNTSTERFTLAFWQDYTNIILVQDESQFLQLMKSGVCNDITIL